MAHLARGAKTDNHNQYGRPSESKDPQEDWSRKANTDSRPRNEIQMIRAMNSKAKSSRIPTPGTMFSEDDPILEGCSGDDPLIITADVWATRIHRIYVDGGSSAEIMYEHCFEQLTT